VYTVEHFKTLLGSMHDRDKSKPEVAK